MEKIFDAVLAYEWFTNHRMIELILEMTEKCVEEWKKTSSPCPTEGTNFHHQSFLLQCILLSSLRLLGWSLQFSVLLEPWKEVSVREENSNEELDSKMETP